jgi:hypothetical protein
MIEMIFKKWMFDERFLMHRLYSTRFAVVVTAVLMGIWFEYELLANGVYHWDIFAFLIVLAVSKVAAMIYYRLTD